MDQSVQGNGTLRVRVRRAPGERVDSYDVPVEPGMSIFNVLDRIRSTLDPTLAFPISCRIGKCDLCLINVDGQPKWLCVEPPHEDMLLEPLPQYESLKDLVIDWERRVRRAQGAAGAPAAAPAAQEAGT